MQARDWIMEVYSLRGEEDRKYMFERLLDMLPKEKMEAFRTKEVKDVMRLICVPNAIR